MCTKQDPYNNLDKVHVLPKILLATPKYILLCCNEEFV